MIDQFGMQHKMKTIKGLVYLSISLLLFLTILGNVNSKRLSSTNQHWILYTNINGVFLRVDWDNKKITTIEKHENQERTNQDNH